MSYSCFPLSLRIISCYIVVVLCVLSIQLLCKELALMFMSLVHHLKGIELHWCFLKPPSFFLKVSQFKDFPNQLTSRRHIQKENTEKDIRKKIRTFCFRKNKFSIIVCSRSGTYYAIFVGCLDLKFLPNIPYCVYWVVAEIWASNSFHKICNDFLFIIATTESDVSWF